MAGMNLKYCTGWIDMGIGTKDKPRFVVLYIFEEVWKIA
jgi:hypothetical protein